VALSAATFAWDSLNLLFFGRLRGPELYFSALSQILEVMDNIPNVLAGRYASKAMCEVWSAEGRIKLERDYWIAVLRAQKTLGLDIPQDAIDAYERVKGEVNLDSINAREAITRHDVKARIEEFCDLAGHEHIHKGLTSRDLTENVEQLQIVQALDVVRTKAVAALLALAKRAEQWKSLVITARTHNVPAQPTTFGKRLAMFGEDLLLAVRELDRIIENYPVRGLKGPVGTQMDLLTLFGGDSNKVASLEGSILEHLGVSAALDTVGQVYPRGLDFEVVSVFVRLASGPSSFAKTLRIMAGHELASEGFAKGQVGSSAMPHKMNSRSCERLNGFAAILKGHLTMASELAGDQWNEGDVSCSVVRRVFLPDSFFAIDGLLDTFITILNQMEVYPAVIEQENQRYGPFLATTTVLMEAVKAGAGREEAHEAIKEHAVQTVRDLRAGVITQNDLVERLGADARLGLPVAQLAEMMQRAQAMTGLAATQVDHFCATVHAESQKFPNAASYTPGAIL
jgi:adenylosuccinate lyase